MINNSSNLWDVEQASVFLNIPKSSVYQLIFHGKTNGFPYLKIGQRVRFRRLDVERWLEQQAINVEGVE